MSIHVNTYILKEFVHFQQETVIIYNKNNKILHTHTHKLYRETDLQLWLRKPRLPGVNRWAQGQYAPHRKAPPGGFEPRIILVWNQTKNKKQQQKGTVPITPSAIQTCRISPHNLQTGGV